MFIIDHVRNTFTVDINFSYKQERFERDEIESLNSFLDTLYIKYNPRIKTRPFEEKRIDEVTQQFDRNGYEYKLTQNAIDAIVRVQEVYYSKETKFYRRSLDFSIFNEGINPFDFQIEDINWSLRRSNYLDANDAGLGKSFCNISVAAQNYKENIIDSLYIVCPGYLCYHWKYEILKFVNVFKEDDIQIINNDLKWQPYSTFKDKKIFIISNHAKVFADSILSYKKGFKIGASLEDIKWKFVKFDLKKTWEKQKVMLIADESHCYCHSTAVRTKALKFLKPSFEYRALLSATPNINAFERIYNQLNIVDKSLIPFSEKGFILHITKEFDRYGNIKEYNTENILKLKATWSNNFRQRLKKDVPEMKVKQDIKEIYFELTPEQKTIYRLILEHEISVLQEEYNTVTWKLLLSKRHLIDEVFNNIELLKRREYSNPTLVKAINRWTIDKDPKFNGLKEKLEDYIEQRNEKVVIYDYRPGTLNTLYEKFKKYNPQIIHGELKGIKDINVDRKQKEDIFNNDQKCKLFLLSSLTSSAGLNLQKSCHRIIVYSMGDDGTAFRQLIDRTHRITSTEDTIVEILFYPETFENIKVQKNMNRITLNDKLGKEITQEELHKLINGRI